VNTRRAPEGAPISYERYMSSPEFAAMRGIPGTAVAAKAQLYSEVRQRSLLFFLQSLSLKEGGLRGVARALLKTLPGYDEEQLAHLLIELCINPKFEFTLGTPAMSETGSLIDAVHDFQDRYEAKVKSDFVLTTIGKEVFETLDHCLDIGKMVVIEGDSGSGKTTAAEAWCAAHQGQARFVSLSGITHKTGFFQKLATAIGLAASKRKATDMQVKVEEFFRRTGLMLIIDEAHYLWPQHQRSHSNPELVDWVNTALVNQNVPVALICTDQFAKLKARAEKRTGWTSEQLEHRVKRYKKLSNTPTKQDLEAIAAKLLAMRWNTAQERWEMGGSVPQRDFIKMIVGYALTCKMPIAAVSDTIMEARYQARKNNRGYIASVDLRSALLNYRIPSDAALQRAFQPVEKRRMLAIKTVSDSLASALQRRCTRVA
jgi:ABC-type dipeptide/oligopeptide/nickel transport system ATPase component